MLKCKNLIKIFCFLIMLLVFTGCYDSVNGAENSDNTAKVYSLEDFKSLEIGKSTVKDLKVLFPKEDIEPFYGAEGIQYYYPAYNGNIIATFLPPDNTLDYVEYRDENGKLIDKIK